MAAANFINELHGFDQDLSYHDQYNWGHHIAVHSLPGCVFFFLCSFSVGGMKGLLLFFICLSLLTFSDFACQYKMSYSYDYLVIAFSSCSLAMVVTPFHTNFGCFSMKNQLNIVWLNVGNIICSWLSWLTINESLDPKSVQRLLTDCGTHYLFSFVPSVFFSLFDEIFTAFYLQIHLKQ